MTKRNAIWGALAMAVVVALVGCSKSTETRTCNEGTILVRFVCTEPLGEVTATAALEGLAGQTTTKDFQLACPGSFNLEVSVTGYEAGGKIKAVVSANAGDMILATNKLVEIPLEAGCTKFDLALSSSGVLPDNPDAPVATNGGTGGGNNGGMGGMNPMTDIDAAPVPDADPTSVGVARGGSCVRDDQCTDGHCAGGVCCDKACDGVCMACTMERTGVFTGQCAFAKTGVKDQKCEVKAASTCGTNGMCNGAGQCSFWDAANECVAAACNGSGDYVPAQKCSGSGGCQGPSPSKCGEYACTPQGCKTNCTVAADCSAGVQCIGGKCGGKRALGEACGGNSECTSPGFCIDGVCCGSKCDGTCEACNGTITGGNSGECLPVPANKGKQADCATQSAGSCGTTGRCDGARKCEFHAAGTECAGQMCSGATQTGARKCDGGGTCLDATTTDCSPGTCDVPANQCRQGCGNDGQCAAGAYCGGNACRVKKGAGVACGGNSECGSNFCADGKCCNQACNGSCLECSTGTCKAITNAEDPGMCSGAKSCSGGGSCLLKNGQSCTVAGDCLTGTCTEFHRDADGDGFGIKVAEKYCGMTPPAGYVGKLLPGGFFSAVGDCCDSDPESHPDPHFAMARKATANLCGSFDWNCNDRIDMASACLTNQCKACDVVACTPEERDICTYSPYFWASAAIPTCGSQAVMCEQCNDGSIGSCYKAETVTCQ